MLRLVNMYKRLTLALQKQNSVERTLGFTLLAELEQNVPGSVNESTHLHVGLCLISILACAIRSHSCRNGCTGSHLARCEQGDRRTCIALFEDQFCTEI